MHTNIHTIHTYYTDIEHTYIHTFIHTQYIQTKRFLTIDRHLIALDSELFSEERLHLVGLLHRVAAAAEHIQRDVEDVAVQAVLKVCIP